MIDSTQPLQKSNRKLQSWIFLRIHTGVIWLWAGCSLLLDALLFTEPDECPLLVLLFWLYCILNQKRLQQARLAGRRHSLMNGCFWKKPLSPVVILHICKSRGSSSTSCCTYAFSVFNLASPSINCWWPRHWDQTSCLLFKAAICSQWQHRRTQRHWNIYQARKETCCWYLLSCGALARGFRGFTSYLDL